MSGFRPPPQGPSVSQFPGSFRHTRRGGRAPLAQGSATRAVCPPEPWGPKMEEKRETEDRTPLRGTLGREALQGVGGEEASSLPHPIGPEAALRGSREGVPSLGPLEMGASAPGSLHRAGKVSQLFPVSFLSLRRWRPCFRPSQTTGETRSPPTPALGLPSLASVSPSGRKPGTATSKGV